MYNTCIVLQHAFGVLPLDATIALLFKKEQSKSAFESLATMVENIVRFSKACPPPPKEHAHLQFPCTPPYTLSTPDRVRSERMKHRSLTTYSIIFKTK